MREFQAYTPRSHMKELRETGRHREESQSTWDPLMLDRQAETACRTLDEYRHTENMHPLIIHFGCFFVMMLYLYWL